MKTSALFLSFLAGSQVLGSAPCTAGETVTYKYDALGRLKEVKATGGPNDGQQTNYQLDNADNRAKVTIVNAKSRVVIVPLNGLTVIPIPDP